MHSTPIQPSPGAIREPDLDFVSVPRTPPHAETGEAWAGGGGVWLGRGLYVTEMTTTLASAGFKIGHAIRADRSQSSQ